MGTTDLMVTKCNGATIFSPGNCYQYFLNVHIVHKTIDRLNMYHTVFGCLRDTLVSTWSSEPLQMWHEQPDIPFGISITSLVGMKIPAAQIPIPRSLPKQPFKVDMVDENIDHTTSESFPSSLYIPWVYLVCKCAHCQLISIHDFPCRKWVTLGNLPLQFHL